MKPVQELVKYQNIEMNVQNQCFENTVDSSFIYTMFYLKQLKFLKKVSLNQIPRSRCSFAYSITRIILIEYILIVKK